MLNICTQCANRFVGVIQFNPHYNLGDRQLQFTGESKWFNPEISATYRALLIHMNTDRPTPGCSHTGKESDLQDYKVLIYIQGIRSWNASGISQRS